MDLVSIGATLSSFKLVADTIKNWATGFGMPSERARPEVWCWPPVRQRDQDLPNEEKGFQWIRSDIVGRAGERF